MYMSFYPNQVGLDSLLVHIRCSYIIIKSLNIFNILLRNYHYYAFSLNTDNFSNKYAEFLILKKENYLQKRRSEVVGLIRNPQNRSTPVRILPEPKTRPTRTLPKSEYTRPVFDSSTRINMSNWILEVKVTPITR